MSKEKEVKFNYKKGKFKIDFVQSMKMYEEFIKKVAEQYDFEYFKQNKDKFVKLITDLKEENQVLEKALELACRELNFLKKRNLALYNFTETDETNAFKLLAKEMIKNE